MDKPIILIDDEDEDYPAIARLIELGRQKSYVTIDDILQFFPEAEQDVEQLEETFAALMSAGIPVWKKVESPITATCLSGLPAFIAPCATAIPAPMQPQVWIALSGGIRARV